MTLHPLASQPLHGHAELELTAMALAALPREHVAAQDAESGRASWGHGVNVIIH